MKKENIYKFLYILAALLVVGFAIAFGVDAYKYNTGGYLGSAPLYVYALVEQFNYLTIVHIITFLCMPHLYTTVLKKNVT